MPKTPPRTPRARSNSRISPKTPTAASDPRVVLCQPVYGHVPPAAHLAQLTFAIHAATIGPLVGIVHARDTYIDWGRNHAVKLAYEQFPDFTHLLWLDGDIIPPVDSLERLLAHDRDIVGGLYVKKGAPYDPVAYDFTADDNGMSHADYSRTTKLELNGQLERVGGLGLGLTMIHRRVLDAIVAKMLPGVWFQTTLSYGEDVWFFHWANQLGFETYLDTSLCCSHVGDREFTAADYLDAKDLA